MNFLKRLLNFFKRRFGGKKITKPEVSVKANPDWHTYRAGKGDRAGRRIRKVYAVDDGYIIYFIGSDLYYETTPELGKALGKDLAKADAALARINRLLDANPEEGSREYDINVSILELAADGFEMFFFEESAGNPERPS
jgi:ABC-type Fe3+-hydroxamate transport system substrate-binding protein